MLPLLVAQLLVASQDCETRCASAIDRCYSSCGGQQKCARRCDDESANCNARCAADADRAESSADRDTELPCAAKLGRGGSPDTLRPCTEAEAKVFKDALNSKEAKQALKCKDKAGNPTACKEDTAKVEALANELGNEKALCKDKDGRPSLCPEAQKKVESKIKIGGGKSKAVEVP